MRALWLCTGLALALVVPARGDEPKKPAPKKAELKTYEVPYHLSTTQHVIVRAKIDGKGPFNFIMDTGAPALFVAMAVCQKLGVEPDRNGWATFDKFVIEGGVPVVKATGRVEDPPQLKAMNALGLAGVELHGVIGYNVLARYRLEIDLTRDKMRWTALDFAPPEPKGLGGAASSGLDTVSGLMQIFGAFFKVKNDVVPRGLLGVELAEDGGRLTVKRVLGDSPADRAGVHAGDRVTRYAGQKVDSLAGLGKAAAALKRGDDVKLTVLRGGKEREITVTAGEGL